MAKYRRKDWLVEATKNKSIAGNDYYVIIHSDGKESRMVEKDFLKEFELFPAVTDSPTSNKEVE